VTSIVSNLGQSGLVLQLQPNRMYRGVLGSAQCKLPISELQLECCRLIGGEEGLAAALALLPKLQHLSLVGIANCSGDPISFPSSALLSLQQLTYLETAGTWSPVPDGLQQVQGWTRLQDLRLHGLDATHNIQASLLSGLQRLTHLEVVGIWSPNLDRSLESCGFEPDVLAGKTLLQHLEVASCDIAGGSDGLAQLLSHLSPLQLTYLCLSKSLLSSRRILTMNSLSLGGNWLAEPSEGQNPPAEAYSALTASSQLQHLDISYCVLPEGVWPHMFHASMQLPHLQQLNVTHVGHKGEHAPAPEGSRLVSCCPGLRSLLLSGLSCSAALLEPLTGLSSL
jgi:hypothetical protein